jgi:hypothetical protein
MARVMLMLLAAAVLAAVPRAAWAGGDAFPEAPRVEGFRVRATPRLALRAMYDDNVDMKQITDKELVARPGGKIQAWDEKTEVRASGDVVLRDYVDHDSLDRLDYFWNAVAKRQLTERFDAEVKADQRRDHMVDSVSETYGFDVEPSVRTITTIAPSAGWRATERTSVRAGYEWVKAHYDKDTYADFTTHQGDAELSYALTERTSALARAVGRSSSLSREEPRMDGEQWMVQGFAGLQHKLTEHWTVTGLAGAGYVRSSYDLAGGGSEANTDVPWLADAGVEYTRLRYELAASFRRTVAPSFYGESITSDRFKVYGRYEATERLDLNLTATYTLSGTSGVLSAKKESEGLFVQPTVNYRLLKDLTLQVGGNFNHNVNRVNHVTLNRMRVWTQVSYELPIEVY